MSRSQRGTHSSSARRADRDSHSDSVRRAARDSHARRDRHAPRDSSTLRSRGRARTRKSAPSTYSVAVIALGLVAVLAVLVFVGAWFFDFNKKNNARNQLETQVNEVVRVDKVLLSLDNTINSKTTTETVNASQAALTQIPTAQASLSETKRTLAQIRPKLRADDRALADAIGKAIEGREKMLATGEDIVSLDTSASVALALVDEGWNKMLDAHEKSDKATKSANRGTRTGLETSLKLNKEVKKELAEAKKDFKKVQTIFPDADLGKLMSYIDGRIKANNYAITGDKATLSGNTSKANSAIKDLNAQNKKSAKQLAKLPKTPGEALSEQYRMMADELLKQYDQAKKDTAEIDDNVRSLM